MSILESARKAAGKERQSRTKYSSAPISSKPSDTEKKLTDYNTETRNAYTSVKNRLNGTTTITSNLTDDERKARISEIESEIRQLNTTINGLGRASAYGNSDFLKSKSEEAKKRKAELSEELKTLKRVGTFTASELKQFEIDDAKAEKAKLGVNNPTARITPAQADAFLENQKAHLEATEKIETLERQKALYDDITKFGDVVNEDNFGGQWRANYRSNELSREADKAMSRYITNPTEENREIAFAYDAFAREYMKNNEKALDDANVKASWLTKSAAGYLPQFKDQIVPELVGGVIGTLALGKVGGTIGASLGTYSQIYDVMRGSVYRTLLAEGVDEETAKQAAEDEALISSLIESGSTAVSWLMLGGSKAMSAISNAATKSVAKGSTNVATKYIANRALTHTAKQASQPLWKGIVKGGIGIVGNAASEYGEEFAQGAVSMANREQALATVEKEIGQFGRGNIDLYNRPIYKNADGTISTVDSVTFIIDDKYVVLSTIVRDENGNAKRLNTDEEVLAHYEKTGEYLGKFDTQEESDAYANKLHSAQDYYYSNKTVSPEDNLFSGGAKVVGSAISGKNPEAFAELHAQGKEGWKIGLMFGGTQAVANNAITRFFNAKTIKEQNDFLDFMRSDEGKESLDALIEEGKASGEGTVSEKIATQIETARENGKEVTRDQVRRLIESNEVYINNEEQTDSLEQAAIDVVNGRNATQTTETTPILNDNAIGDSSPTQEETELKTENKPVSKKSSTPIYEQLEALSQNNEQISVEDVKKASGFGENGAKLLSELASEDGMTFIKARDKMKVAYLSGYNGEDITFTSDLQSRAKLAGIDDRLADNQIAKEKAKSATIYNGTFTENEYTANWSEATKKMVSTVAKHFGMDVSAVDKIIANKYTGAEANASHTDGKLVISNNRSAEKLIHALIMHEGGHRMEQFATDEWNELSNFIYARAERLGRRAKLGIARGMAFDDIKGQHDDVGITRSTRDYVGEVVMRELETIFSSPEEFNKFISEIESNQQVKTAWGKFVEWLSEIIEDLKRVWAQRNMTAEEKSALAEIEHIKELYAKAYLATKDAVAERAKEQSAETNSSKNLENKTNKEYNGNESYALKWHTDLTYSQLTEVENWIRKKGNPEATRITDKTNWYEGRINGDDLFVIYSTEDINNPTILYEVKGVKANLERDILKNLLEEIKNGESVNGKSAYVNWVSGGGWMQTVNNSQNNLGNLGSGQNNQNAGVLQRQSQRNGSRAFWNVIENLFRQQEVNNDKANFSLKSSFSTDGMTESEVENAQKIISSLKTRAMGSKYVDGYASYTVERIEREIRASSSSDAVDYAKSYVAWVSPIDFVYATTTSEQTRQALKEEAGTLNIEKLKGETQPIHLTVDFETGEIVGHEGRHRMLALQQEGIDKVAIIIDVLNDNRYHTKPIEFMSLTGQQFQERRKGLDMFLHNMLPLSQRYADVAREVFTNTPKSGIQFSLKDSDGNTLSKEQAEFFKDSKVRDENGNLLVVYHGSPAKFTVFDHYHINKRGNSHGRGFYFTEKKSLAEGYEQEGGQLLKGYLNITKPLSEDKKTMKKADLLKLIKATCNEEARMIVEDGGYDNVREALRDTWISNCVNTYEMSMDNAYREVLNIFWNGNDNDVELISDLTNSGAGNENTLRQVYDVLGYDGVIYTAPDGTHEFVSLVSEQFKSIDNANPTKDADIRYSLKDSEGKTLTAEQQEYFKDSKVRDENGNLLVMYQGASEDFTVFDRKKSSYANLYGRGFYFTKSEKHASQYGDTRAYYLNIKHPVSTTETTITESQLRKFLQAVIENEDYSFENYGYGATVESVLQSTYGKSDFLMLNDVSQTAIGDLVEAVELFNEINGTDYDGIVLATETVTFNSEQAKLTSNKNPTNDPDTRFSLKKPVEETKNLIAVHNMQVSELERTLDLGGLPMPSIAIIKAQSGHSEYGDVSLVFDKSTIDPKANRDNKVYGGDAWTPVYPKIEYKPNEKVAKKISDKYYELSRKLGNDESRPLYSYVYDLEEQLNRNKGEVGLLNELYGDTRLMQLYLLDSGKEKVDTVKKETRTELTDAEVEMNEFFIKELGENVVDEVVWDGNDTPMAYRKNYLAKYEDAIREAYKKLLTEEYQFTEEQVQNVLDKTKPYDYIKFVRDAYNYRQNGRVTTKTEDDFEATQKAIKASAGEGYRNWVDSLFSGVEEKSGIRNNADYFTNSGNRRSWEALHWENNLENVVKVMKAQDNGVAAFFSGNAIWGVSAKDYRSVEEIKADADRLMQLPEEEYNKIKEGFGERLSEIAHSIMDKSERNPFIAVDNAMECIVEAVRNSKTKSGILNSLKEYQHLTVTETNVEDIVALVTDISNMPTEYFEAKPRRAVGLNEIATAIVPDSISQAVKTRLDDMGIKYLEYEAGNEDARLKALNSLEDVQFSLKENNSISSKDQKELLDIIEHLKGEFELTKFAKTDPNKLAKMTRDLLKEYSSQADFDETYKAIDDLYTYMANGEGGHNPVWEDVYDRAYNISKGIVENALVKDDYAYQEYKHLRDYLRTTPMKFYTEFDSVPSSYESFNEFRKANMGRLKFTKDGASVDSVYQELAHLYPEFFDAEEQINTADQLKRIIDVLDELQPTEINPFDREIEQASMYLANDLTSRFFDVPQAKPTFADKAERRVIEANIKGRKKLDALREQKDAKIKKLLEAQKEKTKKQLGKLREQRDAKVKKEQEKRRNAISKMSENQKVKVLRARIMRHTSDLNKKLLNPTDNQHIPHELQGAVAKLLECINLESNYTYDTESHSYKKNDEGLPTRRTQAFNELKKVYSDIASSVVVDPDLMGEYGLLSGVISLADKRIVDMTSSELDTVWQAIRAIEASVSTANHLFSDSKFATILEVADALRTENTGKNEKTELKGVFGWTKQLATLDMLTPETYLHYLGNAGDSVFRMMRDAQDKHISIMKEVSDFTHKALKDVDVNSLENTIHTVKLGGEDVQLSTAQLMELYVLMKRDQAVEHILIGGILPDVTKAKGLKLNTKAEPLTNTSALEIGKALSVLTEEQKKIADELQRYASSELSTHGNEASMQVYNYEKFTEKNYWPIRTNKNEIQSEIGKDTSVTSVANKGMTKATKPHANTSVRIGSIFDTFASHSSDMATYAAWLGTSEDVNRIRNFVFWEDGARTGTVKGILNTLHGIKGADYLEKLLTDIAIGVKVTENAVSVDKVIGGYKAASVGANLRVIIQQPTAIIRALDMIDARYLAEGTVRPLKGWEKAKKYAPIAQWKDWGYFDINTGRQMKDVLFDNASVLEKTKQVGMWGASMADSLAWGQLWNAVEAETKATNKELQVGSEEYYETVAKRFTEIVDHTQVVDGILQRSQIMRDAGTFKKMVTSFMGEPTKQYNMAMSAFYDFKTGKGDARKEAFSRLGRTAVALATAGIINACAQSIIDAMRDDDKEKDYWEKWLAAFVGDGDEAKWYDTNLADTANPLNYVPFAKDIVSILQGYDVKRMDVEAITKVLNACRNMYTAVTGTGKYTIAESSAQLFAEIARMFGVPVANVKRDVKSLVMATAIETDSYVMQYRIEKAMLDINYAGNSKNFMDILFNAYNNDREAYEIIYKDMLKSGYDADKIQSGMETRMKKSENVEKASDLSKRYMTPEDEKKYDSSLSKVKSSQAWKSANATQRKEAESDLYDFLTSTSEAMEKTRAEARAFGVDETEYTLWQLAKEMVNDDKDSLNAKEKAEAIEMLDLGNSELAYFYNTDTGDKAYAAGINIENFAMFKGAVSGLKGDNKKSMVTKYANEYANDEKEYLFFMGTEYPSYKKRGDYIKYFGK